jgi:hypothetical protein
LAVEVAIARYAPQGVLRGFGGDVLVVVLVFALLQSCVAQPAARLALWALLFACTIECLQALGMVDALGLHDQTPLHRVLRIALGATFDPWDLLAYSCGWLLCRAELACKSGWGFDPEEVAAVTSETVVSFAPEVRFLVGDYLERSFSQRAMNLRLVQPRPSKPTAVLRTLDTCDRRAAGDRCTQRSSLSGTLTALIKHCHDFSIPTEATLVKFVPAHPLRLIR